MNHEAQKLANLRWSKLSPEERSARATAANLKRWSKLSEGERKALMEKVREPKPRIKP